MHFTGTNVQELCKFLYAAGEHISYRFYCKRILWFNENACHVNWIFIFIIFLFYFYDQNSYFIFFYKIRGILTVSASLYINEYCLSQKYGKSSHSKGSYCVGLSCFTLSAVTFPGSIFSNALRMHLPTVGSFREYADALALLFLAPITWCKQQQWPEHMVEI